MSTVADPLAIVTATRHCNGLNCRKCRARYRWLRRKSWRARKSPNRTARDRKR